MNRLGVFALIGCALGAYGWHAHFSADDAPQLRIATAPVTRGDIRDAIGAQGTLQAHNTVQVGAQVSGKIAELLVDFNDLVQRGQVLARIDPAEVETQIEQARASLARARIDFDRIANNLADARRKFSRAQDLRKQSLIPVTEFESARVSVRLAEAQRRSAQAQVEQAEAVLEQRQVSLQHTIIRAPIDGIVLSRSVDVGQTVSARTSAPVLFVLTERLTNMLAIATISEDDIGRVRAGQAVSFRVDAYPTEQFTGRVEQVRVEPTRDRGVIRYPTVITVPNPNLRLRPGMTANLQIAVAERHDVVRVPSSAVRFVPTEEVLAAFGIDPNEPAWDGESSPETLTAGNAAGASADGAVAIAGLRAEAGDLPDLTTIDGMAVPQSEVAREEDVWLLEDGELTPVEVVLGISDGQAYELIAGDLEPGDELLWMAVDPEAAVRPALSPRDLFRGPPNNNRRR